MRKTLILIVFSQAAILFGQAQIKRFVQQNATPILSISTDSTNFEDFFKIGSFIGDAQIVMLGEQDHGDAATFFAKTRLIKYLHEEKGFNVIAFESDFFGLNDGWDSNKSILQINSYLQNNLLSLWAFCNGCNKLLYEYIPKTQTTDNPITVTGFDNQITYSYSRALLVQKLDSVLRKLAIPLTKQTNYQSEVLPLLETLISKIGYQLPSSDFFKACGDALKNIKSQIKDKMGDDDFWTLVVDNLIAFNQEESNFKKDKWEAEAIRDKQMYLNLKWLIQAKYPNQKIIVWAMNNHIARYDNNKYISMGKYLSSDASLSNKIYSVGFTSYEGEGGRLWEKSYTIGKPKSNSFENWINDAYQYAFVDFTNYNKAFPRSNEEFDMRGWRYWSFKKQWNKVYDGIFYIKEMYRCENIKNSR